MSSFEALLKTLSALQYCYEIFSRGILINLGVIYCVVYEKS
jgi:hypothetical protein